MNSTRKTYNRRTSRLQNYDYTQPGFYFVTICTQEKQWMFGEIVNDQMHLNDVGKIIQSTWNSLPERFSHVQLDQFVVMPNHIHGIIILESTPHAGMPEAPGSSGAPERFKHYMRANGALIPMNATPPHPVGRDKSGPYDASRQTLPALGEIVRAFKAASTHHIRSSEKPKFAWQTRYYEHIIRNDKDLDRIRQYIVNNPASWAEDKLNVKEGSII